MSNKQKATQRFDLLLFESFEFKGQKRHKAHRVGAATSSPKGGFVIYIPTGISLTGRLMMVPEKTPLNEVDLLEAYHSAADEFGL